MTGHDYWTLTKAWVTSDKGVRSMLLVLWLVTSPFATGNTRAADVPHQIKAAYLYNFLQFVSFPQELLADGENVRLCLLGEDKFGSALNELEGAATPQGKVKVLRLGAFKSGTDLSPCNVLFFSISETADTERVMAQVDSRKTLTISEFSPFISFGGLIELYEADDRIRFKINQSLVRETLFKVAAQLVQLGVN